MTSRRWEVQKKRCAGHFCFWVRPLGEFFRRSGAASLDCLSGLELPYLTDQVCSNFLREPIDRDTQSFFATLFIPSWPRTLQPSLHDLAFPSMPTSSILRLTRILLGAPSHELLWFSSNLPKRTRHMIE